MPNNCSGVRMDGLQNCLYSTIYIHQCGVWTFKRFEDLSLTCFMHELDCASSIAYFIIHLCPILSLLKNKRMKKQKPRLFILRAAINFGHFWHGTPRSKTIILASFSLKIKKQKLFFYFLDCPNRPKLAKVAHKMTKSWLVKASDDCLTCSGCRTGRRRTLTPPRSRTTTSSSQSTPTPRSSRRSRSW